MSGEGTEPTRRGGMRWGKDGSDAICPAALYLSEPVCWDSFWNPPPN